MSAETSRQQRGREMAGRLRIVKNPSGTWEVPSDTSSKKYIVNADEENPSCSCPDFELNLQPCKHIYAVRAVLLAQQSEAAAPAPEPGPVKAKRPTSPQVWEAYNAAQTTEKHRLQVLLYEMCQGIREPVRQRPKGGRPAARLADVVFAACFKVYSTFSGRRFMCDLQDAHERGYITKAIHYNTIFAYLENPDLTPVLRALVTVSSLPLKSVDVDFATDSSGFATSRFVRWFDEKYGCVRQKAQWVKTHVTVGVKTNVVTAVEIHAPDAGDAPEYKPLLEATNRNFTVREVSADKAYSSVANLQATVDVGATPYIPFKSNATDEKGGLWAKMFLYFCEHRDTFLKHYHKRSNVESTFSAIKAKFGDSVRSKTDTAMVNEVLCKIICHNICCVIQEMHELGIDPVFWEDGWQSEEEEDGEERMILKFAR
jgi:transposase